MIQKIQFGIFLLGISVYFFTQTVNSFPQDASPLQQLIQTAITRNSDLKASISRLRMAELRLPQVKALPDPMLMLQYQNEGWELYSYGKMPESQWMAGITQELPLWGKTEIKGGMQIQEIELYRINTLMTKTRLIQNIKETYYEFNGITQTLQWLEAIQNVLKKLEDIALKQYTAGIETQDNILMIQLDEYMLEEKMRMLEAKLVETKSQLVQLSQIQDESFLTTSNELPLSVFPYPLKKTQETALAKSLEIREKQTMLKMAEFKAKMAQKESLPDIAVNAAVAKKAAGMEDMWILGVTIPLPLYYESKQGAAIKESDAGIMEASHELNLTTEKMVKEIKTDFAMLASSEKLLNLYQAQILPNAQHLIDVTMINYQNGKMMLPNVLTRIRDLLNSKINIINIQVDHEKTIARLSAMIQPEEVLDENE